MPCRPRGRGIVPPSDSWPPAFWIRPWQILIGNLTNSCINFEINFVLQNSIPLLLLWRCCFEPNSLKLLKETWNINAILLLPQIASLLRINIPSRYPAPKRWHWIFILCEYWIIMQLTSHRNSPLSNQRIQWWFMRKLPSVVMRINFLLCRGLSSETSPVYRDVDRGVGGGDSLHPPWGFGLLLAKGLWNP